MNGRGHAGSSWVSARCSQMIAVSVSGSMLCHGSCGPVAGCRDMINDAVDRQSFRSLPRDTTLQVSPPSIEVTVDGSTTRSTSSHTSPPSHPDAAA